LSLKILKSVTTAMGGGS